jgi:peptidyl-prolyl cis-trans isomerase D
MADKETKKIVTKKHLARVERERIQRRYILLISIIIVVAVVVLIGTGFVIEGIIKPSQPIVQVNNNEITTKDYQSFVRFQRFRLVNEYLSTYQFIQNMGDQSTYAYFESYLIQLQNELKPEAIGLDSMDQMIENIFVREEAKSRGIVVSESDIQKKVDEVLFQYFPNGTPTPSPTGIPFQTPTLSSIQETLVPPTPTEIVTDTVEATQESTPTEVVNEDTTGATPTALPPTPTVYTEELFKKNYDDFISYLRSYAKVGQTDIFNFYESIILRERLAQVVVTDLPKDEEVLWARHILFPDVENGESQALEFLAQVESGEDFSTLATQLSTENPDDPNKPIFEDLGWFGPNDMVETFQQAAEALKVGEISQPVQTSFGWHVIQLLGKDIRLLDDNAIEQLRSEAFQTWLNSKRAEAEININPDWVSLVPTIPDIPEQAKIQTPTPVQTLEPTVELEQRLTPSAE